MNKYAKDLTIGDVINIKKQHEYVVGIARTGNSVVIETNYTQETGGAELCMIDLSKPHRATLVKTTNGKYCIEICRFPFWSHLEEHTEEKRAVEQYNNFVKGDKRAAELRAKSGIVRVITTPHKKAKVTTDDFEYIAGILNQYAPDKVKAIRDLQAVYNSDKQN